MCSRRWCFTLNNYGPDDEVLLRNTATESKYLIFGREVGSSGTPHLQGFVIFSEPKRLRAARNAVGNRAHLEVTRAPSITAAAYCKKENDFEEFGQVPVHGQRTDFAEFKEWVAEQPTKPTARLVAKEFPTIFLRYGRCMEWVDHVYPSPGLVDGDPRPWQQELGQALDDEPDDRKIIFVVDPIGGCGKTWFIKWWLSKHGELTQRLSIGKRDDLAFAIDESKQFFFFDIPRSQSEYLQYSVLEQLKDRMVFSPKYVSRSKILEHQPHVVVFMNEEPDYNKLTGDRYDVIRPVHQSI